MGRGERAAEDAPRRPVRVGFVIDALAPGAGTENQLLLLLQGFDRNRLQPFLCCLRGECPVEYLPGVPMENLGVVHLARREGFAGLHRFRTWVHRHRLHAVTTFFRDANLLGTLGARWAGVPVVSTRRNLGYWQNRRERILLRVLDAGTRRFVANSEAVRRVVMETEKVAPERIEVIPNAVDAIRFRPPREGEREATRVRLGLAPDVPVVGCVANLRPVKGHDTLLAAFAGVRAHLPSARLVLVGEGVEEERLRAQAEELGISGAVSFLGRRRDVAELMRAFDVVALASRSEGFSNALLEAMASGVPCVATDVGGNRELLEDGACGRLVPAGDAEALAAGLVEVAADRGVRERMGREARQRVTARFAPEVVRDLWYGLYEERLGLF